jgi:hypothetical protein
MKLQGLALLGLGLLLGSCALDGGSSGTGITTITEGNVASVVTATASTPGMVRSFASGASPAASGTLAGIEVSVEGTGVRDRTDATGAFRLSGDYESEVTIRFVRADDRLEASLAVNVPAGGTLGLRDVALDDASGTATPAEQSVAFDGTLTGVDCAGGELQLVSRERPDDGDVYTVLLAGSSIVDASGRPLACTALSAGSDATVAGSVNPDGTFGDATIEVGG